MAFRYFHRSSRFLNFYLQYDALFIRCQRHKTRCFASASVNDKLPLSGLRVLDMTRVLAGVSLSSLYESEMVV
jgi:hypothetical protein